MVGPCRKDPTALVEQESKGGASETAGSNEMPGRPWACSSLPCPHHVVPPWHSGRVEQPCGVLPLLSQISFTRNHNQFYPRQQPLYVRDK